MYLNNLYDGRGNLHKLDSEKTGDLSQLQTDAKDTLTAAVNEVEGRLPRVTAADEGAFLRVTEGALSLQQLTDVSKEAV